MEEKLGVMARAVMDAYASGEEDEQLLPRVLVNGDGKAVGKIKDGDPVIFYDIRGEREIELTLAFTDPGFRHFETRGKTARFTTMIEYHSTLEADVAFPPLVALEGSLCGAVSDAGIKMVKIVESEKAIHLSYFLNGKREEPFPGERRVTIESDKTVSNYDEKPEMNASDVADAVIEEIGGDSDFIVVNFANVDVVAHIEDEKAVKAAVEAADRELGRVIEAARRAGVTAVVTADHGTAEKWYYPDGTIDTGHTDSPVPFVIVDEGMRGKRLIGGQSLTDVAPTLLTLMGVKVPEQMTGKSMVGPDDFGRRGRLVFIIMDGWGHNEDDFGNVIKKANTPVMDGLVAAYPFTTLAASGEAVGMPQGKVGNSESGHLHIGAGRVIQSDRIMIDEAISSGSFAKNEAFLRAMKTARDEGRPLHLLGIVSFYSSHGSVKHLYELLKMAKDAGVKEVYHHALLGRRGERPEAGARYIDDVEKFCEELGLGRVVTVMGRFWALDREENWDRVEKAYRAMVDGVGVEVADR